MATTIRIKRRAATGATGAPSSLKNGELAYSEKDLILYYGFGDDGAGNATTIPGIAGEGAYAKKALDNVSSQSANLVFSGPATGIPAAPSFRALVATDIPSLTAAKISDFDTQVRSSRLDQMAAPTTSVSLNNQKITGLAAPNSSNEAATKGYVDMSIQGLDPKASVRAATDANITLSGTQTIDGVVLSAGERVLVKEQSSAAQNGIYLVAAGSWTRSPDMDEWAEVPNAYVFVEEGTVNADIGYLCTANSNGTLGTTAISWSQFTGAGNIEAGNGLTKTGSTINAVGTTDRIAVGADSIDISANYIGQATITTLGTITNGTWAATDIGIAHGGTGASDAATARTNLGLAIGTNVQAYDAELAAIAGLTSAADRLPYFTGAGTAALATFSAFGRTLVDDTDAGVARGTLGLGTIATQASNNVSITGGTIDGVTIEGGTY